MGGGSSKQKKQKPSKHQPAIGKDWQVQTRTDNGAVYVDRNGRQAQEYKYILNNRFSPASQFDIYEQRRNATVPIVKSYGAEWNPTGSGLAPKNQFRVLTERIPHRLSQAPQLTYPESMYTLQEALHGYQHLYQKAGSFSVNSDMIGYTPEGQAKVWFNENFGQNHPSSERHMLQSTLQDRNYLNNTNYNTPVSPDEAVLVRNIVQVVEDKCEEGTFKDTNFRNQIYRDLVGFEEARSIVESNIGTGNFVRVNHVDLYNNLVLWRGSGMTQHIVSKPEFKTTTHHYQSNVRPVVNEIVYQAPVQTKEIITSTYRAPVVTSTYQAPVVTSTYQAPVVTSNYTTSTYTPYAGAKSTKNTKYMFNYQAPKQYFHPDMYAN